MAPIKKAYIRCTNGYRNDNNITEQIIYCMDNGEWNEQPIKCTADCIHIDENEFKLMENQKEYLISIVDIIKKLSNGEKIKITSGKIISEREILAECHYFDSTNVDDLRIKMMSDVKGDYKEKKIASLSRVSGTKDDICILNLYYNDYLKFNEKFKPICSDLTLSRSKDLKSKFFQRIIPKGKCFIPRPYDSSIEYQCFESKMDSNSILYDVKCLKYSEKVIKRCQIGYQNKKYNENGLDRLDTCISGNWLNESNENGDDCELKCNSDINPSNIDLNDVIKAPWHVGIYYNATNGLDKKEIEQICSGTLIHLNIVISVGSCFNKTNNIKNYRIGVGKKFYNDKIEEYEQYAGIKEWHVPLQYESEPDQYDISIIILDNYLHYTSYVKPACIEWKSYKNYDIEKGTLGVVAGWSILNITDSSSKKFYETNVEIVDNKQCQKAIDEYFQIESFNNQFCGKNINGSVNCLSDNGSGLISKRKIEFADHYFLIGILTVENDKKNNCLENSHTSFINLQYYQDFIKYVITESRNSM
ncbi:coagulation factor X-like [Condylostylus longicornis]|uniref:coagulation factor X-like n=1 Tax=Condylostylus longicornis TaxID=2530218 RepID=UPI00244D9DAC|nr:coagulation factor X-like [Condylostylus longicornis]